MENSYLRNSAFYTSNLRNVRIGIKDTKGTKLTNAVFLKRSNKYSFLDKEVSVPYMIFFSLGLV